MIMSAVGAACLSKHAIYQDYFLCILKYKQSALTGLNCHIISDLYKQSAPMELRKTLFQVPFRGFRGVLKKSECERESVKIHSKEYECHIIIWCCNKSSSNRRLKGIRFSSHWRSFTGQCLRHSHFTLTLFPSALTGLNYHNLSDLYKQAAPMELRKTLFQVPLGGFRGVT